MDYFVRRSARDAASARLGRFVVVLCCRLGGAAGSSRSSACGGATALLLLPPPSLLRHLSLVWLHHLRARARDVIRGSMTTAIATMTAIAASAAGTREQSGGVAAPRDREMQCSYERRRWLRDGRGGGTGWSHRGGSEVAFWVLSPFSFLPAALPPALRPGPRAAGTLQATAQTTRSRVALFCRGGDPRNRAHGGGRVYV